MYNSDYSKKSSYLCRRKIKERTNNMALEIAAVPVLTGEASDRFDRMMEQSEQRRGFVDFSREINEARAILSKANF